MHDGISFKLIAKQWGEGNPIHGDPRGVKKHFDQK
jgi:hypothetical protein